MENEQETFARIVALATGGRFVLVKRDAMIDAAFDAQKSLAITLDTYTEDNLSGWESDTLHNPSHAVGGRCAACRGSCVRLGRMTFLHSILCDLWVIFLGMGSTVFVVAFIEGVRTLLK